METKKVSDQWLANLSANIESIKAVEIRPIKGKDDNEYKNKAYLGIAPEYYQKLYTLALTFNELADRLALDSRYESDPDREQKLHTESCKNAGRAKLLMDMFWLGVKEWFDVPCNKGVVVFPSYEIYQYDHEKKGGLFNLLRPPFLPEE